MQVPMIVWEGGGIGVVYKELKHDCLFWELRVVSCVCV